MDDMSERNRLLETALTFHAKQLRSLVNDEEVIKFGDEYFNNDLSTEAQFTEQIRDSIRSDDFTITIEYGKMSIFEHNEARKIMLDALKCYKASLEKTIQNISDELGQCIPKFDLVRNEIALCKYYVKNGFVNTHPPTRQDLKELE